MTLPLYRVIIIVSALVIFGPHGILQEDHGGKIVIASLEDKDAVKSLGINVDKYFSIVFIMEVVLRRWVEYCMHRLPLFTPIWA